MKNSYQEIFIPVDHFMIRVPLLTLDDFFKLSSNLELVKLLNSYLEDPVVKEAILIASPPLIDSLEKLETGQSDRKKAQAYSSLLRYLLRMSTRATPFGLFSAVGFGTFSKQTSLFFHEMEKVKKRARPDMEWLTSVIEELEQDIHFVRELKVMVNPLCQQAANRLILDYCKQTDNSKKKISLRSSFLTDFILSAAKSPILYGLLEEKVIEKYPNLDNEKIKTLIRTLFTQKFLISELTPSLLTPQPFEKFFRQITGQKQRIEKFSLFDEIRTLIQEYNMTKPGEGVALLQSIFQKKQQFKQSNYSVQVDSSLNTPNLTLNKDVALQLAETVELLWKLSPHQKEIGSIATIHRDFLEKYGTKQLVSLVDLMDDNIGLGLGNKLFNSDEEKPQINKKWMDFLNNQYFEAIQNQKNIVLPESVWDLINEDTSTAIDAPLSFDIYCEIFAASQQAVDNGDYLLSIGSNTGSGQAGSTFGRFLDILDPQICELMQKIYSQEETLEPNVCFVESTFLPRSPRIANVAIHDNFRAHELNFSYQHESRANKIAFDDLYLGGNHERLFLISRKLKKEVVITASNVLNSNLAPGILRFIRELSKQKYKTLQSLNWGSLSDLPYLPQVRYKKTIISPAKWLLTCSSLGLENEKDLEKIKKSLEQWIEKRKLPRYVYMSVFDNRILLDLQNCYHLDEISYELKSTNLVILAEQPHLNQCQWIKSKRGSHQCEFVIPFVKSLQHAQRLPIVIPANFDKLPQIDRIKAPGSEWLFIKIYLMKEREEEFIANQLFCFSESIIAKTIAKQWYFIRYTEHNNGHIRLRFKGDPDRLIRELIPLLNLWSNQLIQQQQIKEIELCCYEREIYRYGGIELIDTAEQVFCEESLAFSNLLRGIESNIIKLPPYAVAALSIIDLLTQLNLDVLQQIDLLETIITDKKLLEGFRQLAKPLTTIGKLFIQPSQISDNLSEEALHILHSLHFRHNALHQYANKIRNIDAQGKLSSPINSIYQSLIHMSCNRLMGVDFEKENKAVLYAYHTLEKILKLDYHVKIGV